MMLPFKRLLSRPLKADPFAAIIRKYKKKQFYFVLMLTPIMQYVLEQLQNTLVKNAPAMSSCLDEDFLTEFVATHFMESVTPMMIRACVLEMHVARRNNLLKGKTSGGRFNFFIKTLSEPENALDFLNKYASLKTQITVFSTQFCDSMGELFQRLERDKKQLIHRFLHGESDYKIEGIYSSGDVHCQGRSTTILIFVSLSKKIKLIYKPRSVKMDKAFQELLCWFNQMNPKLPLLTLDILDKKNYGWINFIEKTSCRNKQEIRQFYTRLGYLLMLVYLLRGNDIHGENLIAHGAHPIIVDMECSLTPLYSFEEQSNKDNERFFVYDTLFLPAQSGEGIDISALGAEEGGQSLIPLIEWLDIGKDSMHAERCSVKVEGFQSKPGLKDKTVEYLKYEAQFLRGFHHAYQLILHSKEFLLSPISPLSAFKHIPIRLVMRPTDVYNQYLYESWHPKYLLTNQKRSHYFKSQWVKETKSPSKLAIVIAEENDLHQNNIPFFNTWSNGKQLFDSAGNSIASPILKSGMALMLDHLEHTLNKKDLFLQKIFIKNSFSIARQNKNLNHPCVLHLNLKQKLCSMDELKARALVLAKKQLDQLVRYSFLIHDDIYWPSSGVIDPNSWIMQLTDFDFYDGLPGIALCFLYASQIFHHRSYADIAAHCLTTLKNWSKKSKNQDNNLLGAYSGGGILYTLAAYYRMNQDKELKGIIQKCLHQLQEQIKKDNELDIIGGSAGTIILLLSLTDMFPKQILMPLIRTCIQRILTSYPNPCEFPLNKSKLLASKPLLGMAHGVAGIAWALHQYLLITPNKKVKAWIEAGLAYERSEFNPDEGNWPDYRQWKQNEKIPQMMTAWCHGAPGVGLARLAMSSYWDDPYIANEIEHALDNTKKHGFNSGTCVCHGALGNLDFLYLVNKFQNKKSAFAYHSYTNALIDALEKGPTRCSQLINSATPGLMTGAAGTIYALMRIAHPKICPSILLFPSLYDYKLD